MDGYPKGADKGHCSLRVGPGPWLQLCCPACRVATHVLLRRLPRQPRPWFVSFLQTSVVVTLGHALDPEHCHPGCSVGLIVCFPNRRVSVSGVRDDSAPAPSTGCRQSRAFRKQLEFQRFWEPGNHQMALSRSRSLVRGNEGPAPWVWELGAGLHA